MDNVTSRPCQMGVNDQNGVPGESPRYERSFLREDNRVRARTEAEIMLICAGLGEERLLTRTPGWKKGKEVCLLPAGIKRPKILRFAPEHRISRRAKALLQRGTYPLIPAYTKIFAGAGAWALPGSSGCQANPSAGGWRNVWTLLLNWAFLNWLIHGYLTIISPVRPTFPIRRSHRGMLRPRRLPPVGTSVPSIRAALPLLPVIYGSDQVRPGKSVVFTSHRIR